MYPEGEKVMNDRSPKESAELVHKTVSEIRKQIGHKRPSYSRIDWVIENVCKKHNVSEEHIRTVGGWKKRITK